MPTINPFEFDLFSPEAVLDKMETVQNRALDKTAHLHNEHPVYPKKPSWVPLPSYQGAIEVEKYDPSGSIKKEIAYNPYLIYQSLLDPSILLKVAEHEGIHAGTPGKILFSHFYYDSEEGKIKLGKIDPEDEPRYKYPIGKALVEGGVKVISEKIGGVEQKSYPLSSKLAEEIDRKLAEINKKYSLIYINKLLGKAEKKLVERNYYKFSSNPADLKISEVPVEVWEVLHILNQPQIIEITRNYAPKTDLFYVF